MDSKSKPTWFDLHADKIIIFVGGSMVLIGFSILGFQCFLYLKTAIWPVVSVIEIMNQIGFEKVADRMMKDWKGVHSILSFIPASLMFIVFGYTVVFSRDGVRN